MRLYEKVIITPKSIVLYFGMEFKFQRTGLCPLGDNIDMNCFMQSLAVKWPIRMVILSP